MGVHLLVDYYEDARLDRRAEILECLRRNLDCPHVDAVHDLGIGSSPPPAELREHPKYRSHPIGRRLMFTDAFAYASAVLPDRFVGVSNLDIFLDGGSDWALAERLVRGSNLVLCQSRWEQAADGSVFHDPAFASLCFANTQDAWFFVPPFIPPNADFELGTLGCDNAIADRILKAGRMPVNLGSRFRVIHVDRCRGKHGGNTNAVHEQEHQARQVIYSRFPERDGYYLTPDFDMTPSLDKLAEALQLTPLAKYRVLCDMMSQAITIKN
jgi:hypothetical protein